LETEEDIPEYIKKPDPYALPEVLMVDKYNKI